MARLIPFFLFLLAFCVPAQGATYYVPDDFSTIQAAIDGASGGDTIIVRPGTYRENIDFRGKALIVMSQYGAYATEIDGGGSGSTVTFQNNEGSGSVLDGFTVTKGSAAEGGGLMCVDASPTLIRVVVAANSASGSGGGICCRGSSPGASPALKSCMIFDNCADSGGGLASLGSSAPFLMNVTFTDNIAAVRGGGISCETGGLPSVTNSIIWGNSAAADPEIHDASGTLRVNFCDVRGGWAGGANIDADPLFADPAADDYHLTFDSPCRNMGYNGAPGLPDTDFEGDPRIPDYGITDMGGEEFYHHLYFEGTIVPGSLIDVKVTTWKLQRPVILGLGSGILDPPKMTPLGPLYLQSPIKAFMIGIVPPDGIVSFTGRVPIVWMSGEEHGLQARIFDELTNLMVMKVE